MKNIILLIILIASTFSIYGQEDEIKKFNFQFDLGTTISIPYKQKCYYEVIPATFSSEDCYTEHSSDFGYYIDLVSFYNFNNKISIGLGVNYVFSSYKINDKYGYNYSEGKLINSYLNIPISIKYKISEKIPISISLGTYFGLLINANENGTIYFDTTKLSMVNPNDPLFKPMDYNNDLKELYTTNLGLSLQLDYEFKFNDKIQGFFITKFNYGIKNIISDDYQEVDRNNACKEWKNYNLLIGIGLKI